MQINPAPFIFAFAIGGVAYLIGGWTAVLYTEIVFAFIVSIVTAYKVGNG